MKTVFHIAGWLLILGGVLKELLEGVLCRTNYELLHMVDPVTNFKPEFGLLPIVHIGWILCGVMLLLF